MSTSAASERADGGDVDGAMASDGVTIDMHIESTEGGAPPPSITTIFPPNESRTSSALDDDSVPRQTADRRMSLASQPPPEIPRVYSELRFKGIQDPYNEHQNPMVSTLNAANLDTMLSGGLRKFFEKFKKLSTAVNLHLQTPEIRFENLSFKARSEVKQKHQVEGTVGYYLRRMLLPCVRPPTVETQILHPMTGIIPPGSMTLLLANPGAGKSTFLKALAGKLRTRRNRTTVVDGDITYSGLTASDIDLSKLVSIVDQRDNHCATLTVRETFKFADLCLNGKPRKRDPSDKLADVANLRTELMLHVLGLSNCADTVVGDALLRGVSGGERKRVTVGEMLVGGQSIFLCDEISTGLDSAATFDIVNSLRSWTKTLGGSCIVALLQPPPEVVELFDDILMLSEGHLVYHGPRQSTLPYFQTLGFSCPPRTDPSDFLIEVVSGRGAKYYPPEAPTPFLSRPEEFSAAFVASDIHAAILANIAQGDTLHDAATIKRISYMARKTQEFGLGVWDSTKLLIQRQKMLTLRDKPLLYGKTLEALVVGLLLGVIYLNGKKSLYLRMCFFSIAIFQRQAWQRITISFALRNVFYKQRSRNFFRTLSYTIADTVVQVPMNLAVSALMGTIFYFMSGLAQDTQTFFIFLTILVVFQHAIGAYFTLLSSLSPSITVAQACAGISVAFFLLFSGNIIKSDLIPTYWRWMYWLNPLAWALRSVMLNEFYSGMYSAADTTKYLNTFQIREPDEYYWIGILVLVGYFFFFTGLYTIALHVIRWEDHKGAKATAAEIADAAAHTGIPIELATRDDTSELKFVTAFLTVKDLNYYVTLPTGEEKHLLHDVTAFFEPGTMTALMGSSGAGKTTFMDVIAGRKTGGRIVGDIHINGETKDPTIFSRITAYCEQMDIHSERATVREALEFSVFLRLPESISTRAKLDLVDETLRLLELDVIAHELILTLSVEQKKRVTIGVEVVSNPSILFLDEPTSGLDARSAQVVMRGVQSIARTGRTVVCTIHQPSIQIFELFDSLLLLQKGGRVAYFGELGHDSQHMLEYFYKIPGTEKIKPLYNPATYMLEVIGAGIGRKDIKNYADEYAMSTLCAQNVKETIRLSVQSDEMVRFSTLQYSPIATGLRNQLGWLMVKSTRTYWRSPAYNFVRIVLFPIFALIFGSTFWQLGVATQAKVDSHVALIYNSMDFIGVINMMTVLDITCLERAVYYRERMSNYYSVLPYSVSLFVAEIPYLVVISGFFVAVEYWMVGWYNDAGLFFFFWLIFFLYISLCTFLGQWMAVLLPNAKVANVAIGALSCLLNLFSGFLLPFVNMKAGYKWVTWVTPSSYALNVLVGSQLEACPPSKVGNGCTAITINGVNTTIQNYILTNYGFDDTEQYTSMGILILEWCVLQVFIFLTLKYVCHLKR
ncbi:Aste57867_15269 [Aphanomyces stellatus]|uniref:Aste57867_15269 protein n=1 Tax=Aphanomyces stellatus TaxID=120398 RepID=A0A485L3Q0_9STRA|nr:hypothetical protein As57867_015213 [Aphanomyces stellatus]VFT92078.1 Aste57867_15269 [Aphanomyces stellatus]